MTTPAVRVQDLRFAWPGNARPVLDIPHFSVAQRERVFLYGPSGSGKTTLLNLLAGVAQPQAGLVEILGTDLARMRAFRRDRFRARHIGVIFQQFNLIPYLSVADNVNLALHFAGRPVAAAQDRFQSLFASLGLAEDCLLRPARQLSVGQQQRVAVARALIAGPELVIADEPSSALDSDSRDSFIALLKQAASECGSAILFVSHDHALSGHFDRRLDIRDLQREAQTC